MDWRIAEALTRLIDGIYTTKAMAVVCLSITLFVGPIYAESIEIKVNKGGLRLRQHPTSTSDSCGTVANRSRVTPIQSLNGWHQIRTNNSQCPLAWVHGYFTKDNYKGPQSSEFLRNWNPSTTKIKLDDGFLRVRQRPSFSGKSCGSIANGTSVEKLSEIDGWYLIKTGNPSCPTAWIHGYYTEGQYQGKKNQRELSKWIPSKIPLATDTTLEESHFIETPQAGVDVQLEEINDTTSSNEWNRYYSMKPRDEYAIDPARTGVLHSELANGNLTTSESRLYEVAESERELCMFYENGSDRIDEIKSGNCRKLMDLANQGQIPKEALVYSLNYLKLNLGGFQDSRCLKNSRQPNPPKEIANDCQFVINDFNKRIRNFPHRSPSYFIDLCDGGHKAFGKGLLHKSFTNRGTGSSNNNYADRNGAKSTVIGPLVTGSYSAFTPIRRTKKYRDIGLGTCTSKTPIEDCKVPRLELYGLVESNNSSTYGNKPMHVSPYKSSLGCPSIPPADQWRMVALYRNGPSLVMNYGPEELHSKSSLKNCKNQ